MSRFSLVLCLALVVAFGGLGTAALVRHAVAGGDSGGGGVFHSGSCGFRRPLGQQFDVTIRCGTVTVPQDWGSGRALAPVVLPVAVFKASGPRPGAPVLMLQGGPGFATLGPITAFLTASFAKPLQTDHDLVLFDQRGTGGAQPPLSCSTMAGGDQAAGTAGNPITAVADTLARCHDYLAGQRVDPALFTTEQAVRDSVAVMRALGYHHWDVYGVSYGGFEAVELAAHYPARVDAVVLDSPMPVQRILGVDLIANLDRAITAVLDECAASSACSSQHPDLGQRFAASLAQLVQRPKGVSAQVRNPSTGGSTPVTITAATIVNVLDILLRERVTIDRTVTVMEAVAKEDWNALVPNAAATSLMSGLASGETYLSTTCHEQATYIAPSDTSRSLAGVGPALRSIADAESPAALSSLLVGRRLCQSWGVERGPADLHKQLSLAAPALVLGGRFDPVVSPDYLADAGRNFRAARVYILRDGGHGPGLQEACGFAILSAFLAQPAREPDHGCLDTLPAVAFGR